VKHFAWAKIRSSLSPSQFFDKHLSSVQNDCSGQVQLLLMVSYDTRSFTVLRTGRFQILLTISGKRSITIQRYAVQIYAPQYKKGKSIVSSVPFSRFFQVLCENNLSKKSCILTREIARAQQMAWEFQSGLDKDDVPPIQSVHSRRCIGLVATFKFTFLNSSQKLKTVRFLFHIRIVVSPSLSSWLRKVV
jgi:hypothetical protein